MPPIGQASKQHPALAVGVHRHDLHLREDARIPARFRLDNSRRLLPFTHQPFERMRTASVRRAGHEFGMRRLDVTQVSEDGLVQSVVIGNFRHRRRNLNKQARPVPVFGVLADPPAPGNANVLAKGRLRRDHVFGAFGAAMLLPPNRPRHRLNDFTGRLRRAVGRVLLTAHKG